MNNICLPESFQDFMDNFECKPNIIEFSSLPTKENPFVILDMNLEERKYEHNAIDLLQWDMSEQYDFSKIALGKRLAVKETLCTKTTIDGLKQWFDMFHPDNHHYSEEAIKGICNIQHDILAQFEKILEKDELFLVDSYIRTANRNSHNIFKNAIDYIKFLFGYEKIAYTTDNAFGWHIDYGLNTTVNTEPINYRTTLTLKGNFGTYFYKDTYCQSNGEQILSNVQNGVSVEKNDITYAKIGQLGLFKDHCAIHGVPKDEEQRLLLFLNFYPLRSM